MTAAPYPASYPETIRIERHPDGLPAIRWLCSCGVFGYWLDEYSGMFSLRDGRAHLARKHTEVWGPIQRRAPLQIIKGGVR